MCLFLGQTASIWQNEVIKNRFGTDIKKAWSLIILLILHAEVPERPL